MAATLQSDVTVNYANQVMSLVSQLRNLRAQIQDLLIVNTNNPLGTKWNALTTTLLNGDGSLGTVDGTPTSGHYVDSRVYPNLQRVVTNTNLTDALQILVDLNTFCAGTALSANAARPAQ